MTQNHRFEPVKASSSDAPHAASSPFAHAAAAASLVALLLLLLAPPPRDGVPAVEARQARGVAELAALGVRRISVGSAFARAAWGVFMKAAREILTDGRFDGFAGVAPNKELNDLFRSNAGGDEALDS